MKVAKSSDDGREKIMDFFEAGAFFGEMALLDRAPRSASVKTYVLSQLGGKGPWGPTPNKAKIFKGDFSQYVYVEAGTAGGITTYTAANSGQAYRTTLTFSGGEYTEHFADGMAIVYAKQKSSGNRYEIIRAETPAGVATNKVTVVR